MVRLLQAGGGTLNKRYESRSLRHIVQHGDPDRDRFWEIPDIPWKEDLPDDELDLPLDHDTDDLSAASELSDLDMDETNTALTPVWQDEQPLLHSEHCRFPPTRYPVWERRVRLLGETRLYLADCNLRGRSRLIPHDVRFTSPPTLPREIIICGSVLARFENTGGLTRAAAMELGLVGVAARACGLERDVRRDFPSGVYQSIQFPVATWKTGDVFARAFVRWLEVQRSAEFIHEQLQNLPAAARRISCQDKLPPSHLAVALTEGWRGEICHVALTGADGRFTSYKVVDPSFHNWFGLAQAMRGQQISDFPLCNKSFNLSYCGHDL